VLDLKVLLNMTDFPVVSLTENLYRILYNGRPTAFPQALLATARHILTLVGHLQRYTHAITLVQYNALQ
jgi:hypothetical protein